MRRTHVIDMHAFEARERALVIGVPLEELLAWVRAAIARAVRGFTRSRRWKLCGTSR